MGRISKNALIVDKLNDRELAVYGQALLCAQFPRLCISTPSGSASPELYSYTSQLRSNASATESISLTSDPDESASVIPTETLCEILRLAFGITRERAAQYERMVYEQYKKKTREKILVEELMSQLSFLENNKHPFYNSSTFLSKSAYEQWQQLQRQHIMALINKIWHFSLPPLKGSIHYNPAQFHENYKILMEKMVRFENSNRPDELGSGPVISSPLSTAALRLLKEYGLRYGVGEQYRRLVYLEYLAEHFENEVWYIQHLHSVLEGLLTGLPSVYSRAVMVQQEYEMFLHTSDILYGQCENSLTRIRRLFTAPNVNAAQGVATLLELLALTLRLKTFLQDKTLEPMDYLLTRYTKKSLVTSYERHKLISLTDLQISTLEDQITPKLISRVIILIRNDVKEYKDVFNTVYASYLDIARLAAKTFYTQLMEDMRTLCSSITPSQQSKEDEILPLLALVYKLNQLDSEWADYIEFGDQSWRQWMVPESLLWMDLLRKHSRQFIMQAVCADKFEPVTLKNRSKVEENLGRTQSVTSTTTTKSLSHYEHSAFTPVKPNQRTQHVVASTSRATQVTMSPARRLPCASNSSNQQMDNANDSFQVPQVQSLQAERFQQQGSSAKSGIYIAKSLSSPELVNLKKYARSIDKLQSNIGKTENVHSKSHNDLLQLRGATNKAYCDKEMPNIPKKSSSVIISLPGSLGSDNNNNLMESGNFSFMRKGKQRKERTTKYENTPMKKSVVSSHSTEPADLTRFNQPHIEIIGVTQLPKSSQTLRGDIKTLSSDSETDYEIMDSDYSESSGEDDGDFAVDGNGQNTFPPLTAIETSWNGSLGSLCFQEYMEAEQMEPKRSPRGNVMEYPKEEKEKAVVQFIGTRGTEKEKNSPGNAFHKITKLTGEMLDAQIKRNEKQRSKIGGERISTPISSARSTPTVHWDPTTVTDEGQGERKLLVSGSLVDISCLTHRLINFAGTLCKTLCPLTTLEKMGSFTENDLDMLKSLIRARNNILDNLLQTVWLIVSDYTNNLLAFDLCGTSENKAKALVNMNLVDDVKNEFKAGFIWGCRHQQNSTFCNEYINKKAVYLADRFEPITEKMCLRLNNVWSLLGSLTKFKKEAQCAAELDHMKTLMNRLRPVELDEVLNEYDVVDLFEDDERQELQHDPAALNETSPKSKDSKNVIFAHCNDHLNMAVEGLASLLAYRMNLFFTEALHLLLSIDIPGVSLTRRLVPATEFLHNHLVTLHEVLYQPCYNHTVRKLWTLVVRDFETELDDLSSMRGYTTIHAKQLLEVIASYLRFFKNHASEIDIDEFTQETEDVCERLQLHTLSTKHLVKVHRRLDQLSQMSFSETVSDEGLPDKEFMEVMRKHLHAERKSFDGSTLVQFLLSNIHKFHVVEENRDVSEKESSELVAEKIAQRLLDAGIIVCNEDPIQTTHPSESTETSLNSASPYPTMGIYSSPSCSASLHKSDAFSQAFRKTSESMVERCIPSEDEEPLTFGDHPRVLYAGVNAKKLIERRRASRRKTEEEKMGLSRSLPDNVNASPILMFGRSSPNDILSQSFDATLLQDKTEDHSSPAAMRNGGFGFLRSDDKIHMSASTTRATTASPSVVSHVSYSCTEHFQNSADQFYRFAGQFDELLFDLDEEDNNVTLQSSQLQPDVNDQLQKVNGAMYKEKKITTEFVLNILNTRKSVDALAKNYLQSLPEHILSTAHLIAHHPPVVGCFGFIS